MTPERWRQVTAIFHDALSREGAAREMFVRDACAEDPSLRAEVERLLAGHDRAGALG